MDDWMRFKEAGFLDEAEMERKDRLALHQKIEKLENEYNTGLLIVERKEWTFRHEELSQELAEVEELYKREQSSHLIAVSEAEKREDSMEEALIHEKQRIADLEKSLRELDKEQQHIHFESEKKLSEASNLAIGIDETSAEVNAELLDATAKLAEVDCKWSELDLKMQELEAHEHFLHREQMSLKAEQEAHKATFYQKTEDLIDREKSLMYRIVHFLEVPHLSFESVHLKSYAYRRVKEVMFQFHRNRNGCLGGGVRFFRKQEEPARA